LVDEGLQGGMRTPDAAMLKIKRLFHYQPFKADWLMTTLLEEKIWFSNPADFNDPTGLHLFLIDPGVQ
jgi:hypothetical protein